MKKQIICTLLSALLLASSASALASDNIEVYVDKRTVQFEDQEPVIINDRVLVPVRGVFEALGAEVHWDGEQQKVTVFAKDNLTRLILYIDSCDFKQVKLTSIMSAETTDLKSEVAPQLINGRTMIPLYLVADYMGNKADWNGEERSVTVTSKERLKLLEAKTEDALNSSVPKLSISTDKTDVNAGDEVTIKVNLSNTAQADSYEFVGATSTISYNNENFTFKSCKYSLGAEPFGAFNPNYMGNRAKVIYMNSTAATAEYKDGVVAELTFVANNDLGGSFALTDFITKLGYDNSVSVVEGDRVFSLDTADKLYIDTTPIEVK